MSDKTASARPHCHVTTNAGVDEGAAISIRLVESPVHGGMHIVEWHNLGGLRPGYHRLYAAPSPAPACEECGKAEQCFDCAVAEVPVQTEPNSSGHSEDARYMLPSVQQLAEALNGVRCFHDLSAELIAPTLRANLIVAIGEPASDVVPVPRPMLEDLRDCANECYNHARMRGTSGLDNYERLTEQADALLNGGRS